MVKVPAAAVRQAMRGLAPLGLSGRVPISVRRVVIRSMGLSPLPRGVTVRPMSHGGVPTEYADPHPANRSRLMIYLHGGGYVGGSAGSHRPLIARVAKQSEVPTVAVDYRRAPEHPFPAAFEDVLTVHRNLLLTGAAPDEIVLAGDSAGGGLALAVAMALRDSGETPAGLALICPWVDLTAGASWRDARTPDPVQNRARLASMATDYLRGVSTDPADPRISPLHGDFEGLPPTVIHSAGDDPLARDAEVLIQRMLEAGVSVDHRRHSGLWHDFHIMAGTMAEADDAVGALAASIRTF